MMYAFLLRHDELRIRFPLYRQNEDRATLSFRSHGRPDLRVDHSFLEACSAKAMLVKALLHIDFDKQYVIYSQMTKPCSEDILFPTKSMLLNSYDPPKHQINAQPL